MRALHFLKTLGAGSFGTVYLAELSSGEGFHRNVAVKVILDSRPDNEMFISRIRDEARLLGMLQGDGIIKVLDMVHIEGKDAVVMEYVEGVDLEHIIKADRPPSPRALAELGSAVAGALSRAHSARHPRDNTPLNVIHRDVKPANIMVTRSGAVKLLDFGVARAKFERRESQTGHLVLGTLNYMAPEYIVSNEVSPALDVYGLGLSLWEIAAGRGFGQPKIRQNSHDKRLNARISELKASHTELVPVLERMLQWDASTRPSAQQAERMLMSAADQMRGSSLRSWATQVIPQILTARKETDDNAGLLGRRISLSGAPKINLQGDQSNSNHGLHEAETRQIRTRRDNLPPSRPSQPSTATRQAPSSHRNASDADHPVTVSPSQKPTSPPKQTDPNRELLLVILKGLIAGAAFGMLIIAITGYVLISQL